MKTTLALALVFLVLGAGLPSMAESKQKPAIHEAIFDLNYLKQSLGKKALVVPNYKTGKLTDVVSKAIQSTRLEDDIQFYALPLDAKPPVPRVRQAPVYPFQLRQKQVEGEAHFLMLVGADGRIKGLYCHEATDPAFADSAAKAVTQWLFVPAKLGKTDVPVLCGMAIKFILPGDVTFVAE